MCQCLEDNDVELISNESREYNDMNEKDATGA